MVIAVRALTPSFPGGSLIAPQRNWMRNATRGEEGLGKRLVLIGAPASGFDVGFIFFFSFEPATPAGNTLSNAARTQATRAVRGIIARAPRRRPPPLCGRA